MDVAEISRFAIKALIAAAIGVIACFIVVARVDDALDNRARQAIAAMQSSVHGGSNFWAKIEADLEKLADPKNDLPPEKRKKLLTQIKTLADRWRPLVVEALSVVDAGRQGGSWCAFRRSVPLAINRIAGGTPAKIRGSAELNFPCLFF